MYMTSYIESSEGYKAWALYLFSNSLWGTMRNYENVNSYNHLNTIVMSRGEDIICM